MAVEIKELVIKVIVEERGPKGAASPPDSGAIIKAGVDQVLQILERERKR